MYGGENIEWIRKFTKIAKEVGLAAQIPLEMLYVGKNNTREKIKRNIKTINEQNLSNTLQDWELVWFFWVRLESMWHSKMQHGKSVENDPIMEEIVTMLSFDASDQGWALFCQGKDMAKGKGETILQTLTDFDSWKSTVPEKGFVPAMNDYLNDNQPPHHCNRLILPGTTSTISAKVVCAECGRPMEKFIMYRCCDD